MSQIVIDEKMSAAFRQLREPTSIADSQGNVLGVFTPQPERAPFDLDAAEKALRDEKHLAIPTSEVLGHLHALENRQ